MRQSILVVAVLSLILFSSNILAQTSSNNKASQTDFKTNANFDCTAATAQTPAAERLGNATKCYQQGLKLFDDDQITQAAEKFRQAVQLNPEYADAYAALGRTYFKLREWQKAIDNLNRSASLNVKQREAPAPKLDQVQSKTSSVPTAPPPITNRESTSKVNSAPASFKQNTAAIVEVNKPAAPVSAAPAKETQSTPKNNSIEPTPVGVRVGMSVTPEPNTKEAASPAVSPIPRSEEIPLTKIYRVGANDVLDVRLNDSDQQSTLYTITATGLLAHPLLSEPMSVTGLTVEEISTKIEEDLRKRAIVEDPKALIGIRDYASHTVLVSGLVKEAGTKFLRREAIPLYVVVADAQPLPEAAKVTVVRNELNQIYEIDLNRAADMNFLVRSGDVITLSPNVTQFVYIGGEIKFPGEKTFRRGLTLMQAILAGGGVEAKAKTAEIARDDGKGFLVPTRFKLKEIVSGKLVDPILKPGDRISILR